MIKEFGNDNGNILFAKQDKRLNEIIEATKNKTENQMKTLAQTILPRIALYQVFSESSFAGEETVEMEEANEDLEEIRDEHIEMLKQALNEA